MPRVEPVADLGRRGRSVAPPEPSPCSHPTLFYTAWLHGVRVLKGGTEGEGRFRKELSADASPKFPGTLGNTRRAPGLLLEEKPLAGLQPHPESRPWKSQAQTALIQQGAPLLPPLLPTSAARLSPDLSLWLSRQPPSLSLPPPSLPCLRSSRFPAQDSRPRPWVPLPALPSC